MYVLRHLWVLIVCGFTAHSLIFQLEYNFDNSHPVEFQKLLQVFFLRIYSYICHCLHSISLIW